MMVKLLLRQLENLTNPDIGRNEVERKENIHQEENATLNIQKP